MPNISSRTVITNTSPICYLSLIGLINIFPQIYSQVLLTPDVQNELEEGQRQGLKIPDLNSLEWLVPHNVSVPSFLDLIPDLGRGEASVLALALEYDNPLVIMDDLLGRRIAEMQGFTMTGTLGILVKAKKLNIIDKISSPINLLEQNGFYISDSVKKHVLNQAEE